MSATPEQELQWAMQDLRIAAENLDAAERRLKVATEAYDDADKTVMKAMEKKQAPVDCNQWSREAITRLERARWRADDTHETYAARNGLTPAVSGVEETMKP